MDYNGGHIYKLNITSLTLVKWGQNVENNLIGVGSGIMDQFDSMMGRQKTYTDKTGLCADFYIANVGEGDHVL